MGRFIVVEGIDGAGTTTLSKSIVERLRAEGQPAVFMHQPSESPAGQLIRKALRGEIRRPSPEAMALLFAADRMIHVAEEIQPALAHGNTVVCDRYVPSSLAYQTLGDRLPEAWVRELNSRAPRPDLMLVVDVLPDVAQRRREARGGEPEIYEASDLQRRLAAFYSDLGRGAERETHAAVLAHVDGNPAPDRVMEMGWAYVQADRARARSAAAWAEIGGPDATRAPSPDARHSLMVSIDGRMVLSFGKRSDTVQQLVVRAIVKNEMTAGRATSLPPDAYDITTDAGPVAVSTPCGELKNGSIVFATSSTHSRPRTPDVRAAMEAFNEAVAAAADAPSPKGAE